MKMVGYLENFMNFSIKPMTWYRSPLLT